MPEGWQETEIGDIASIISGGTPKSGVAENFAPPGEGIAWLTPADLSGYKDKYISHGARDLTTVGYSSCSAKLMPKGTILFSSRAPIGYVAIAANEIATNQGFKSFVFTSDIFPDYAFYYLRNIKHIAEEMGTGTTFKEISGSSAKRLPFVIPPIAEQKVIAGKLDMVLAQVGSIKARLKQIPKILKLFRQALIAAAVNGKLTQEWRNNEQYLCNSVELGELARFIDYRGKTPVKTNAGVPLITAKNIRQGYISREPREYISEGDYESWMTRGFPKVGDVLITTEAPMGNIAIIDIVERFALAQRAICLQFKDSVNSTFACIYMQSDFFQHKLNENCTGSTVKGIKASLLKKIEINYPPLPEQQEIVRRVEQLFSYAATIEKQVNNALTRVNNLTQSITSKAFRGELTVQWRTANPGLINGENSAIALLEKIKYELEELQRHPKPKRSAIKKKTGKRMSKQIIKVVEALIQAGEPLSGQQLLAAAGYPGDSSTDDLEKFFLDMRQALTVEKSIVKLERSEDGQDWFSLAEVGSNE
nr:restriction endonuclease subunit S [Pantoea ananatis]